MESSYVMMLLAAVASMIVGGIWYGPLFGKKWMEVIGVAEMSAEKQKEMQKKALPLYGTQFVLTLLQVYVLANLIWWTGEAEKAIGIAFFMWLGFILPTLAGGAMWTNNSARIKWMQFLIQAGYQLIMFILFGYLFSL